MVFIFVGGYYYYIGFNIWYSKGGVLVLKNSIGLFYMVILYFMCCDLVVVFKCLIDVEYLFMGVVDYGVLEVLYLDDFDGNGVELYWDRLKDDWF